MFLQNGWYAAIWADDLKDRPVGRIFLNDKVVLFRNASALHQGPGPAVRRSVRPQRRRGLRIVSRPLAPRRALGVLSGRRGLGDNPARPNEQRLPPATGTEGRTDLCGSLHGRQERCHSWGERGFLLLEGDRVLCRFHCSPDHRVQTCDKLLSAILPEHGKGIFCADASGRGQPLLGRVDDGTAGAQRRSRMDRLCER